MFAGNQSAHCEKGPERGSEVGSRRSERQENWFDSFREISQRAARYRWPVDHTEREREREREL